MDHADLSCTPPASATQRHLAYLTDGAKWSQTEIAEYAGRSNATVTRIRHGDVGKKVDRNKIAHLAFSEYEMDFVQHSQWESYLSIEAGLEKVHSSEVALASALRNADLKNKIDPASLPGYREDVEFENSFAVYLSGLHALIENLAFSSSKTAEERMEGYQIALSELEEAEVSFSEYVDPNELWPMLHRVFARLNRFTALQQITFLNSAATAELRRLCEDTLSDERFRSDFQRIVTSKACGWKFQLQWVNFLAAAKVEMRIVAGAMIELFKLHPALVNFELIYDNPTKKALKTSENLSAVVAYLEKHEAGFLTIFRRLQEAKVPSQKTRMAVRQIPTLLKVGAKEAVWDLIRLI